MLGITLCLQLSVEEHFYFMQGTGLLGWSTWNYELQRQQCTGDWRWEHYTLHQVHIFSSIKELTWPLKGT